MNYASAERPYPNKYRSICNDEVTMGFTYLTGDIQRGTIGPEDTPRTSKKPRTLEAIVAEILTKQAQLPTEG